MLCCCCHRARGRRCSELHSRWESYEWWCAEWREKKNVSGADDNHRRNSSVSKWILLRIQKKNKMYIRIAFRIPTASFWRPKNASIRAGMASELSNWWRTQIICSLHISYICVFVAIRHAIVFGCHLSAIIIYWVLTRSQLYLFSFVFYIQLNSSDNAPLNRRNDNFVFLARLSFFIFTRWWRRMVLPFGRNSAHSLWALRRCSVHFHSLFQN